MQSSEEESDSDEEEVVEAAASKPAVAVKGNAVEAEDSDEESDEVGLRLPCFSYQAMQQIEQPTVF